MHADRHLKARKAGVLSPFPRSIVTMKHADRHPNARNRHLKARSRHHEARSKRRFNGCGGVVVTLMHAGGQNGRLGPKAMQIMALAISVVVRPV